MPEGDTIAYAAARMRPVLEGAVPEEIHTPHPRHGLDHWPRRLGGRTVTEIRTHGKHLFIAFEGDYVLHSHLRMTGSWGVYPDGTGLRPGSRPGSPERAGPASSGAWRRAPRRAWLVLRSRGHDVVQFNGPLLELITEGRARFDQRLAALGPDVLAGEFDYDGLLRRLRGDDQTRGIADALLDQRNVAGIGNIWKAEGCWEAAVDPWRPVGAVSDDEVRAIIAGVRPRMLVSATMGRIDDEPRVFRRTGRPCPRCGTKILARPGGFGRSPSGLAEVGRASRPPAGDDNRTTFWCPGCQR